MASFATNCTNIEVSYINRYCVTAELPLNCSNQLVTGVNSTKLLVTSYHSSTVKSVYNNHPRDPKIEAIWQQLAILQRSPLLKKTCNGNPKLWLLLASCPVSYVVVKKRINNTRHSSVTLEIMKHSKVF